MRLGATLTGFGLLVSMGLTGCGVSSPIAPSTAVEPSNDTATPQEVEGTGDASTSGTYEVQQYYRDVGGGMMSPTRGVTPTYRQPFRPGPVYMGRIPIYAPPVAWRPSWQQMQDIRMQARARAAAEAAARRARQIGEMYRMARWQAIREAYYRGQFERADALRDSQYGATPAIRADALRRLAIIEQRLAQYRREMYFPGQ